MIAVMVAVLALRVASNREFTKVAPLLWMRAGSQGRRIDDISAGWDVAGTYGVLADLDQTEDFLKAVAAGGVEIVHNQPSLLSHS